MQSAAAHQEINRTAPAAVPLSRIGRIVSSDAFTQATLAIVNASLLPGTRIACGQRQAIVNGPAYAAENGDIWVPTNTGSVALHDITSGGIEIDVEWHHDEPMAAVTMDEARGLMQLAINVDELLVEDANALAHEVRETVSRYQAEVKQLKDENGALREELQAINAVLDRCQREQATGKESLDKLARVSASAIMEGWLNERSPGQGALRVEVCGTDVQPVSQGFVGSLLVKRHNSTEGFKIPMPAPMVALAVEGKLQARTATITIKLDSLDEVTWP